MAVAAAAAILLAAGLVFVALAPTLIVGGIAALAVVGIAVPGIVLLAAHAILPWEDAVARRFLVEADRRMRRYPGRVLGITGSYGKTSTKYVVADLLAPRYRVLKTPRG